MRKQLTALALALVATQTAFADTWCDNTKGLDKAWCWSALGASMVLGGGSIISETLFSAISPRTEVAIELPSGERITGKASRKLLAGRQLVENQPLKLTCAVNTPPLEGKYGYAQCEVMFPLLEKKPSSPDYYEREGKQPGWGIGANQDGLTDPSMLSLTRPLVWVQGQGR